MTMDIACPRCGEPLDDASWAAYTCSHCGQDIKAVVGLIYPHSAVLLAAKQRAESVLRRLATMRKAIVSAEKTMRQTIAECEQALEHLGEVLGEDAG